MALEVHGVDIEYGPKPRGAELSEPGLAPTDAPEPSEDDIPFGAPATGGLADMLEQHDLRPMSSEEFEPTFGHLPTDSEGF